MSINLSRVMRVAVAAAVLFILVGSCGDESKPTSPEVTTMQVSGTIRSHTCWGGFYPSPTVDHRYVMDWHGRAKIAFVDSLGNQDSCFADDSSNYAIDLVPGKYNLILETDHSIPDTLPNLVIGTDTTVDRNFRIDWLTIDTVTFNIFYDTAAESLGEASERAFLLFLSDRCEDMLVVDSAIRSSFYFDWAPPAISVKYTFTTTPHYRMWQVFLACDSVLTEYEGFFPEDTWIGERGYVCFGSPPAKFPPSRF